MCKRLTTVPPEEETEMALYVGIDLHATNSVVVVINDQDHVMYQQRLANHLPAILEQLAPYQAAIQGVVVEST
jgi:transposase